MLNPPQPERMERGYAVRPFMVLLSLLIIPGSASAALGDPPQGTPRKIVSDDFTKNRQEAPATASNKAPQGTNSASPGPRPPRRTYRLASQPVIKTRPSFATIV